MNDFEKVKTQLDLVRVITNLLGSGYTSKDLGVNIRINPCPFCDHKDCFNIHKTDQYFKCQSCDEKGDMFDFTKKHLSLVNKGKALEELASRYNIEIQGTGQKGSTGRSHYGATGAANRKQQVWQLAAKFYHDNLMLCRGYPANSPGFNPYKYQTEVRQHKEETLKKFMVGWTVKSDLFFEAMRKKEVTKEELIKYGLWKKEKDEKEKDVDRAYFLPGLFIYPHYHHDNILHFSIKDPKKKIDYQLLGKHREKTWFFYNQDAIKQNNTIILVEGENDLFSLYGNGYPNVMAIIGQISYEQLKFLHKNSKGKEFVACFDNDDGGHKYTEKIGEFLSGAEDCKVRVMDLSSVVSCQGSGSR